MFGRQLLGGPVDPAAIAAGGFTIVKKKAGPFELEIESVKALFEDAKPASADIGGRIADAVLMLPPDESVQPMTPAALT